jgi:1-acyl-sn-glycerol-3-phosphate acyltransferase
VRPTPEQLALLTPTERLSLALCDEVNQRPRLKAVAHEFLRRVASAWVHACTRNLVRVHGLDHVVSLRPPGGVLLVANHRSFFDLYVITMVLLRHTRLAERVYFPVRAEFFYSSLPGLVVNGLMSAWSMYPPVLRQPERSAFNKYGMARLEEVLAQPGTLVGFHPEGRRGKGDDPYTLLPAQPGVGQIILQARPTVVPAFVLGLGNDFLAQIRSNFDGTGTPINVVFGAPLDLAPFYAQPVRLRTAMAVARFVREAITRLGEEERALRAAGG